MWRACVSAMAARRSELLPLPGELIAIGCDADAVTAL